jgi:hypothetical protein
VGSAGSAKRKDNNSFKCIIVTCHVHDYDPYISEFVA